MLAMHALVWCWWRFGRSHIFTQPCIIILRALSTLSSFAAYLHLSNATSNTRVIHSNKYCHNKRNINPNTRTRFTFSWQRYVPLFLERTYFIFIFSSHLNLVLSQMMTHSSHRKTKQEKVSIGGFVSNPTRSIPYALHTLTQWCNHEINTNRRTCTAFCERQNCKQ